MTSNYFKLLFRLHAQALIFPIIVLLCLLCVSLESRADSHIITQKNQQIEVDIVFPASEDQVNTILDWIERSSAALLTVYKRWPRDKWKVKVDAMAATSGDPVPWAQVNRGNPDTVSFFIDASASKWTLISDWTAYHEFSHLLIPYRGWGDMWFSEGLASYYQNIIQARAGVISERSMWQKLYNGFVRGRDNKLPNTDLAEVSDGMHETGSYMRVYWSGALYFMKSDLALRKHSQGKNSLDTVLARLNRCCADQFLSARDIAAKLDQFSGSDIFITGFDAMASSKEIPEFDSLFESLGMTIKGHQISLNDKSIDADKQQLREGFIRMALN